MITEDYVSFETAKLLKEKGFECVTLHYYYDKDGDLLFSAQRIDVGKNEFVAPTLQMTMKWLREIHKIEVRVIYDNDKSSWYGACNPMNELSQILLGFNCESNSYEEACESAIKYYLENLI